MSEPVKAYAIRLAGGSLLKFSKDSALPPFLSGSERNTESLMREGESLVEFICIEDTEAARKVREAERAVINGVLAQASTKGGRQQMWDCIAAPLDALLAARKEAGQ